VPPPGFTPTRPDAPPGTWSDDGAQALCLLQSLLICQQLSSRDFALRLLLWLQRGHLAVDGIVFDVGIQTRAALDRLNHGVPAESAGPARERDNGNGSLMRVLPLALWHRGNDAELCALAARGRVPAAGIVVVVPKGRAAVSTHLLERTVSVCLSPC